MPSSPAHDSSAFSPPAAEAAARDESAAEASTSSAAGASLDHGHRHGHALDDEEEEEEDDEDIDDKQRELATSDEDRVAAAAAVDGQARGVRRRRRAAAAAAHDKHGRRPSSLSSVGGRRARANSDVSLNDRFLERVPLYRMPERVVTHTIAGSAGALTGAKGHGEKARARKEQRDADEKLHGEWLEPQYRASEWLNLFGDLVVVAVLSVFSQNNHVRTPKDLADYLSFFVVVWHTWISQVWYDTRFQADDWYHRGIKLVQLVLFAYLGGGSGHWNPAGTHGPESALEPGALTAFQASLSFLTTTLAYAGSRAVLAVQYAVVFFVARWAGRRRAGIATTFGVVSLSTVLVFVAALLPSSSEALAIVRVTLFYVAIIMEMSGEALASSMRSHPRAHSGQTLERMSALTLIILGEGLQQVLLTLNKSLNGFSTTDNRVFSGVFCVMMTLFLIFMLQFGGFSKKRNKLGHKQSFVYIALHFPLHFLILILISGLNNNLIGATFVQGVTDGVNKFDAGSALISQGGTPSDVFDLNNFLLRAQMIDGLIPTAPEAFETLEQIYVNETLYGANPGDPDLALLTTQYAMRMVVAIGRSYEVELGADAEKLYEQGLRFNCTIADTPAETEARHIVMTSIVVQLLADMLSSIFRGTLWLFPAAGGVLIFLTAVNFTRTPQPHLRTTYVVQLVAGVILCLLGMLAIGPHQLVVIYEQGQYSVQNPAPLFDMVETNWALGLVTICYVITWLLAVPAPMLYERFVAPRLRHTT